MGIDIYRGNEKKLTEGAITQPARPGAIDPRVQQVDVFPLDAFEFDDPKLTTNPRVMLKDPWVWEVQSEIDALKAEAVNFGIKLQLSNVTAFRNRANVVTPTNLVCSGADVSGVSYAGRFKIRLYCSGGSILAYTSSSDEVSKSYAVPATVEISSTTYFVDQVEVSLYSAGGTTELLDRQSCIVTLEIGESNIYFGALTADPASGFIAGDYYWDNNTVGTGTAGTPRIYNGTAWVEFEPSMAGYQNAMIIMLADMGAWATAQGSVVAAASAIFQKLVTTDAFIANLFAQSITVGSGGRIRYETGAGVQKRVVQLADEKIDWLDTPDTSPASPELLVARIGRLGVGGPVVLDGNILAPIDAPFVNIATIASEPIYQSDAIQDHEGNIRIIFGTATQIKEVVIINGVMGSPVVINTTSDAHSPSYGQYSDGRIVIAYHAVVGAYKRVFTRTRELDGTLGAEVDRYVYTSSGYMTNPAVAITNDNSMHIAFVDGNGIGNILEIVFPASGGMIGPATIDSGSGSAVALQHIQPATTMGGELRAAMRVSGALRERTNDVNGQWSSTYYTVAASIFDYPVYTHLIKSTTELLYRTSTGIYKSQFLNDAWQDGVQISATTTLSSVSYLQLINGDAIMLQYNSATSLFTYSKKPVFSLIGAGIIESGSDAVPNKYWILGDGTKYFPNGGIICKAGSYPMRAIAYKYVGYLNNGVWNVVSTKWEWDVNKFGYGECYDTTWRKTLEFYMHATDGIVRVTIMLQAYTSSSQPVYGRIYVNDVAVGTERSTVSTVGINYTEDISIQPGDRLQIYGRCANASYKGIITPSLFSNINYGR